MPLLASTDADPTNLHVLAPDQGRFTIQNLGPNAVFLGDENVTEQNGFRLEVDSVLSFDGGITLFAVSAGSSDVRVLSAYVTLLEVVQ